MQVRSQPNYALSQHVSQRLPSKSITIPLIKSDQLSFGQSHSVTLNTLEELCSNRDALREYYQKAQAISEWIVQTVRGVPGVDDATDWTNESINPYYSRIPFNGPLYLSFYYSFPGSLFTPLGKMPIIGGGASSGNVQPSVINVLRDRLGLQLVREEYTNSSGYHGPVYAITKDLEGNPLPFAPLENEYFDIDSFNDDLDFYQQATKLLDDAGPMSRCMSSRLLATYLQTLLATESNVNRKKAYINALRYAQDPLELHTVVSDYRQGKSAPRVTVPWPRRLAVRVFGPKLDMGTDV